MNLSALRKPLDRVLLPLVSTCALVPIPANAWTLLGTLSGIACGLAFYQGYWGVGILAFLVRGLLDNLDGYVARSRGEATIFGAVLDDMSDRFVLGVIFAGGCLRLAEVYPHLTLVCAAGITGSLVNVIVKMSIYIQIPGDTTVHQGKVYHPVDFVGLFGTPEFMIYFGGPILIMSLTREPLAGAVGAWLVAILSHISLLQRLAFAWRRYGRKLSMTPEDVAAAPAAQTAPPA